MSKDKILYEPINIALDFLAGAISRGCENHKVDKLVLTEEGLKRIIITIHDCDMNGNLSLKDKEYKEKLYFYDCLYSSNPKERLFFVALASMSLTLIAIIVTCAILTN